MSPRVVILMADYGHDPTETAIPWAVFQEAGFTVDFATESGTQPACDEKMLSGITGALLGANKTSKQKYQTMQTSSESFRKPSAWNEPGFRLEKYDLVFLPGGHEKGMRQLIDSSRVHELLLSYFPQTVKPSTKSLAAICHGVQVLAMAKNDEGKSIISETKTTALPAAMEEGIFQATRLFLGDYYKTYGSGTDSVQKIVTDSLNNTAQFVSSIAPGPFVVEDPKHNYLSARFPPDAELLAKKAVELVNKVTKPS